MSETILPDSPEEFTARVLKAENRFYQEVTVTAKATHIW